MTTIADRLLSLLDAYGVAVAFGIPGIHTVELYRTLAHHSIRHVTPRHEQGAGFMAYGYAFATGRPAACFLITGPGLLNAATAIAEAYSESLPVLVISAGNQRHEIGGGRGFLHETQDQHQVEKQIAGVANLLLDGRNLDGAFAEAFSLFATARPRPVCLQIPRDLLGEAATSGPVRIASAHFPPAPARDAAALAASLLANARKPIAIVGGGAWAAGPALRRLAEATRMPVVSTNAGKGILPETHELSLGSALPFAGFQQRLAEADVVLAVGTELAETDLLYTGAAHTIRGSVIRVDIDPRQMTRNCHATVGIVSDAALALTAIADETQLVAGLVDSVARTAWLRQLRALAPSDWSREAPKHKAILDAMMAVLDPTAIICADSTQLAYTGNHYYRSQVARTWLFPNGYGTLGSALPAAIGARLGAPDRQVVAIVGDGSFLYTIAELATAVEQKLALPIVLWNNLGYGEIRDAMLAEGVPPVGVDLPSPDFCSIARGFGCEAVHLRRLEDFSSVLSIALMRQVPTLIQVDSFDPMFADGNLKVVTLLP